MVEWRAAARERERGEGCPHQMSQPSRRPLSCVTAPLIGRELATSAREITKLVRDMSRHPR